jgi:hypothetical protein
LTVSSKYGHVLKTLFELRRDEQDARTLDNICAAVCRLIHTHSAAVPLADVSTSLTRAHALPVSLIQCNVDPSLPKLVNEK